MLRDKIILPHLSQRLMELYCPNCHITCPTKWDCRDHLIGAIGNRWNIDCTLLPGEQTFYLALRGIECGSAMKEKLAIFYFAITDAACRAKMNRLYLDIAKKQRMEKTPYWNRFVEEYRKAHQAQTEKSVALSALLQTLKNMPKQQLKKVVDEGRRLLREK